MNPTLGFYRLRLKFRLIFAISAYLPSLLQRYWLVVHRIPSKITIVKPLLSCVIPK
ncbi:Uncharacterised protein [Vibrio cholerae]|nr:Uncharacterised protein [Vibrio cholerae]